MAGLPSSVPPPPKTKAKRKRSSASSPTVGIVSLGCPKATVDTEHLLTALTAAGYHLVGRYRDADLVIVNTCGFIEEAIAESLAAIGEALRENGRVIVTGCLGARRDLILNAHPSVLAVTGPHAVDEVMALIRTHLPPPAPPLSPPSVRLRTTPAHYAYLKIAEGCNQRCTFCIIPQLRGPLRSRPLPEILREAEALVAAGVKELILVAQDTAAYGTDLTPRTIFLHGRPIKQHITQLARLLGQLGVWVRLHYLYPYPYLDQLVELMAEGLLLPYLDTPLQHASPRILQRMRRPAAAEKILERIHRWREICPDLTIRSTFIVGFPGETEADFHQLIDFLEEAQLDRVGVFAYSPVEGAVANTFPDPLPEAVREERRFRLLETQEAISRARLTRWIGREITVLVDAVDPPRALARSSADAPEIDGIVFIENGAHLTPGSWARVLVIDSDAHDLIAELSSSPAG
ncbi:MAG: 30S ribosomal protein S12 methylthiotransferase RimO [Hydrogenophilus sp.]|nr:30S ribosomal protein S12 methylthiotransferase RimO [Hydrogenophilus sp.]